MATQSTEASNKDAILKSLNNQALYRTALIHLLQDCQEEQDRETLCAQVSKYPELAGKPRSASSLIDTMLRAGALAGTVVVGEQRMTEDEFAALAEESEELPAEQVTRVLQTTPDGAAVLKELAPQGRLAALYAKYPESADAFSDVLCFVSEPRSLADVAAHMVQLGYCIAPNKEGLHVVNPSFVLENLRAEGLISWEGGWTISRDGELALSETSL